MVSSTADLNGGVFPPLINFHIILALTILKVQTEEDGFLFFPISFSRKLVYNNLLVSLNNSGLLGCVADMECEGIFCQRNGKSGWCSVALTIA